MPLERAPPPRPGLLSPDGRRCAGRRGAELLLHACRRFPPALRDLMHCVSGEAFVFHDAVGMVTLPSLSRGRVVFLGDAGYCPTILSGMRRRPPFWAPRHSRWHSGTGMKVSANRSRASTPLMRPAVDHYHRPAATNLERPLGTNPVLGLLHSWLLRPLSPSTIASVSRAPARPGSGAIGAFWPARFDGPRKDESPANSPRPRGGKEAVRSRRQEGNRPEPPCSRVLRPLSMPGCVTLAGQLIPLG